MIQQLKFVIFLVKNLILNFQNQNYELENNEHCTAIHNS